MSEGIGVNVFEMGLNVCTKFGQSVVAEPKQRSAQAWTFELRGEIIGSRREYVASDFGGKYVVGGSGKLCLPSTRKKEENNMWQGV